MLITSLLFSFLSYSFKLNGFFKANTLFCKSFLTVHVITTEMTQGTNFVIDSGYVLLVIMHNELVSVYILFVIKASGTCEQNYSVFCLFQKNYWAVKISSNP